MGKNLTHKILESHLVEGKLIPGEEIGIKIDQTLLQDATGTMAMLEFEALGLEAVRTQCSVQYVDHNILQGDHKNADDHRYLQTASMKYGIHFSPPGNGICHQVHLERFGEPGKTLLGADSHTPSAAGVSMFAMGAGGLDVVLAMAGRPYYFPCPKVLGVKLIGELPDWVSAKDVVLEMLRRYDVKGCLGKVIEYYGPGVATLTVTDRLTIGNMGTELGATSSVFPSDHQTLAFLQAQGREGAWVELGPDPDATYDEYDEIDLSSLEPLIACPSSPGNVKPVREVAGVKVHQVIIGSCVNSSFRDLMTVAKVLEARHVNRDTFFHVNPGSRQVLENVAAQGGLIPLLAAGARLHESGCMGCIGMGQAPGTGQVSLRTFPRNFPGRSGTKDDQVYLCSPETAVAAALKGMITDPRDLGAEMAYPRVQELDTYLIDTSSIIFASPSLRDTEVIRGPNIRPLPAMEPLPESLEAEVLLKVGDNISTDTIMPAGSDILPLRSNIEALSQYAYCRLDHDFATRCKKTEAVVIVGGENYGQGSSREHAALAPRYLGVQVKIAKSFARIHKANLCNFGILPLVFKDPSDYEGIAEHSKIILKDIRRRLDRGEREIPVEVGGRQIMTLLDVSDRQRNYLLAGGALNSVKEELG
ncbi:MAG: aconitate hydratase [Deltaproteobacteria bacterium]|nr:aconitate hydratase [Deltaproteobacteria bacterium]MBW1927681.1 aconitate hydratase [Deltaproteobacteria bacterium]MBW2026329.1 aconitate hydratase [Deltaproteobacteria bacterium]MBW2125813.1 aconitate hydratase [Deltaproteobacteria bacterium]